MGDCWAGVELPGRFSPSYPEHIHSAPTSEGIGGGAILDNSVQQAPPHASSLQLPERLWALFLLPTFLQNWELPLAM